MTISDEDIAALAASPKKVVTNEGSVEERSVSELIEAQQHVNNQTATTVPLHGLRVSRCKPAGPV